MKKYVAPAIEYVEYRSAQRIAMLPCTGSCLSDVDTNGDGKVDYYFQQYS